jgi:hypothetical protein
MTPAEHTTTRLQDASRGGMSVMIPGSLDARVPAPVDRAGSINEPAAWIGPTSSGSATRARLEYEREGGGAPSPWRRFRARWFNDPPVVAVRTR